MVKQRTAIDKQEILDMIRSMAKDKNGKAPGSQRFQSETGVGKSAWYPKHWLRWGDAIREAGCQTNSLSTPFDTEFLINKYIDLIRELGRFPIEGDLIVKRKNDGTFPNRDAFSRLGGKSERAARILGYCKSKEEHRDIIPFLSIAITNSTRDEILPENSSAGYVYLVRHGSRREYKIGRTGNPIRREGQITIELPEKLWPIHCIKTDDPAGVENYWHRRFSDKRMNGEWFGLTSHDVQAFKRWKHIY